MQRLYYIFQNPWASFGRLLINKVIEITSFISMGKIGFSTLTQKQRMLYYSHFSLFKLLDEAYVTAMRFFEA